MDDRRTSILKAAARCIAQRGVRGLRVQEVAREAGVSPGLLYYHFTDRAGLLAATFDFISARAAAYTTAGAAPRDAAERLRRLIVGELQEDPEVMENSAAWGELRASAIFEPSLREPLARATAEWNADVASAIADTQRDGLAAGSIEATAAAQRLTALVEGLSNRWLSGSLGLAEARALLEAAIAAELGLD